MRYERDWPRPEPTHTEIASRISTRREAVSRELNQLSRAGVVQRRSGTLVVRDVERLEVGPKDS